MTKARDRDVAWGAGYVVERNGKHQARWADGDRWRAKTFASADDAYDHVRTVSRAKRSGTYAPPSTMTVSELIAEHLERATNSLSERTIYTYEHRAETMIAPFIGSRKAIELTTLDVQRWIDRLGKEYQASTIHPAIAVLAAACREAKRLGIIERNPCEGIRRPSIGKRQFQTWTEEEARRVLVVVEGDELFCCLYHVALATGMRPGEIRAISWADVDTVNGVAIVRQTVTKDGEGREYIAQRTKVGHARALALSTHVVQRLKLHRARQRERRIIAPHWVDLDLVFDRGDGHWMYQSFWWREHQRICARANVPLIRCHDIRHTSASLELAAGTHPKIVAERLGHSSIQITLDLYSHVSADLQRAAADALAARLFGATTSSEEQAN